VFTSRPARPPLPGATYGTFAAVCHYTDGTFVPAASHSACAPRSPTPTPGSASGIPSADDFRRRQGSEMVQGPSTTQEDQMSVTASGIREISLVTLPSYDQDRSIEFYVGSLGFEKRTDVPFGGGYRWVEVYPPGGTTGIALAPPREGDDATPMETGITLASADVDATHAELRSRGVDVDEQVSRMGDPVPPMFWFRDPDGHSLMVVEQS
jgi:catechol 2,3-dioxygenase-like lactoylglutathione lyase family enzyme